MKSKFIIFKVLSAIISIAVLGTVYSKPADASLHYTRADLRSIIDSVGNSDFRAPQVETDALRKDITGVTGKNPSGQTVRLNVGDTWHIQNPDGTVANYHGYRLVAGITWLSDHSTPWYYSRIGLFAQKIGDDQDISSWKYLGYVFNDFGEGKLGNSDVPLNKITAEWSGSSVLLNPNDDSLRFIYTNFSSTGQYLTTAKVSVVPQNGNDWNSGLKIDHSKTTDHKTVFGGDGSKYAKAATGGIDKTAMRDPHIIYDNGQPYVVFQGSTGSSADQAGENNLTNRQYYGLSDADYQQFVNKIRNQKGSDLYTRVLESNSTIGIIKLNSDFSVNQVFDPLVTFNGTGIEMERANIFEKNGKWYIFATSHGSHLATQNKKINHGQIQYMFGFVSDNGITGNYKPLNGNGLVLASDDQTGNWEYSFLVIPNDNKSNRFMITSFLNNRTFAPSYEMEINGNSTKILNDKVFNQGALTPDGKSFKTIPQKSQNFSGYLADGSADNGGFRWYENNKLFTGFRYYMGTYYWFDDGVRQDNQFHEAWGHLYYTDANGRAVQGDQVINGQHYNFGNDGTYYMRSTGYFYDGSSENGGYRWYENGQLYTGFRYYMGTYYWFVNGVRQNAGWRQAWGLTYYTDANGRAVQGIQIIDGQIYNFGTDGTYYKRPLQGYIADGSGYNGGYRWYENGQLFSGFRYYMGTYYWFVNGVRQNAGWRQAWGLTYYTDANGRAVQGNQVIDGQHYFFGTDGTYYLR
ncbi:glycoside hydrolase family 68 protein [Fructobacillus sp. CRL 2054]|uniref:glycoside hydrolase family 68 protein n=1 Tax=Fructobacillus sp. CRL 2054 TaxID=2763007 RepID=UPI002378C96F|nr:glycoside hydrolase family 68 protein [Fructobacillus sp. CRL 2054]MDD9138235.1 glycoside hydrolase family 68 protein [Fructobacillus sp. CRL 2054]